MVKKYWIQSSKNDCKSLSKIKDPINFRVKNIQHMMSHVVFNIWRHWLYSTTYCLNFILYGSLAPFIWPSFLCISISTDIWSHKNLRFTFINLIHLHFMLYIPGVNYYFFNHKRNFYNSRKNDTYSSSKTIYFIVWFGF